MKNAMKALLHVIGVTAGVVAGIALGAGAAQPGPPAKVVISGDPEGLDGWTMSLVTTEIKPGSVGDWHYHNGHEIVLVQEGSSIVEVRGQEPRTYRSGEAYIMPRLAQHRARNASKTEPYKLIAFTLDEKGKPQRVDVKVP